MSPEEEFEEYAHDKTVRFGDISAGDNLCAVRLKYHERTKQHGNLFFDKLQNHKNVLDLGSGYGFFAEECLSRPERKFNIEGVEIGDYRIQNYVGGIVHNVNFYTDTIPESMLSKFDAIICLDMLEHLSEPVLYLEKIKPLMSPNAKVYFKVPNIDCYLCDISKEYSDFIYISEHCSYYSKSTLQLVFEKAGYENIYITVHQDYCLENHQNWLKNGKPQILSQMYMTNPQLEWINTIYKQKISEMGKGDSLIIEANPKSSTINNF